MYIFIFANTARFKKISLVFLGRANCPAQNEKSLPAIIAWHWVPPTRGKELWFSRWRVSGAAQDMSERTGPAWSLQVGRCTPVK